MSKEERDFLQSSAANRPDKASAVEVEFGRAVTMRIPRSAGIRVLCFMFCRNVGGVLWAMESLRGRNVELVPDQR
jgi:hypothetical protein